MTISNISYSCVEESQLEWLISANPMGDVETAIRSGNTKYAAVYGYTYMVPGMEAQESEIIGSKNFFAIEGTSDDLCSENHAKLNDLAFKYAKKYNSLLAQKVAGT